MVDYIGGKYKSPCVSPCIQSYIKSVFKRADKISWNGQTNPSIIFYLNPEVDVIVHSLPHFQPLEVLQDLGSSLGLWLGLGVIQALEALGFNRLQRG